MTYSKKTWVDEVLTGDARYDILEDGDTPIHEEVQIVLTNVVAQAGSAVDATAMNNIEDELESLDTSRNTGKTPVPVTWVYASATSVSVPSGAEDIYSVGDKWTLDDNGTVKYGYVVEVTDTILTLFGDLLTDHVYTANYYNKGGNMIGHPMWFEMEVPVTAETGTFTSVLGTLRGFMTSRLVTVQLTIAVTTRGTADDSILVEVPFPCVSAQFLGYETDSSTFVIGYWDDPSVKITGIDGGYVGGDGAYFILSGTIGL